MNREIRFEDSCHEIHEKNCGTWRRENSYVGTDISEELAVGATVMLEVTTDTCIAVLSGLVVLRTGSFARIYERTLHFSNCYL